MLFFSYLQHAFASSKKYSHKRVCWSIPWETGHKLSRQKFQNSFSDFILMRLGGHYNFVLISMLDKCPPVRMINKIPTDSAETGFYSQWKAGFHVWVNDETNLEQLALFKVLKHMQNFCYLWMVLNISELGFHAALWECFTAWKAGISNSLVSMLFQWFSDGGEKVKAWWLIYEMLSSLFSH